MRLVSFNVNGIRARQAALAAAVERLAPDVLALQETKVADAEFPVEHIVALGYPHLAVYGQKGHYGVAIASRLPFADVQYGLPGQSADQDRRFVAATIKLGGRRRMHLVNGYFPQGEARTAEVKFRQKARFYADTRDYMATHAAQHRMQVVCGDMNVAPQDADIGIGSDNARRWLSTGKAGFLPEEREWLGMLTAQGLADVYALHQADAPDDARRFSWFDYRSKGFEREPRRGLRIDLILANGPALKAARECGIDYATRAHEKPSDHCPVWCDFDF